MIGIDKTLPMILSGDPIPAIAAIAISVVGYFALRAIDPSWIWRSAESHYTALRSTAWEAPAFRRRLGLRDQKPETNKMGIFRRKAPTIRKLHAGYIISLRRLLEVCRGGLRRGSREGTAEPFVYLARGRALIAQGDLGKASTDIDHALELNPKFAEAFAARGIILMKKHD